VKCLEFEVVEQKKNRLEVKVIGADHTILNLFVKKLQSDSGVEIAAYNIEHPLVSVPKMVIETKASTTPKKALEKAVKDLKKDNADFLKAFDKAF
jgi:DNA-directed RNA polymerase subunit L